MAGTFQVAASFDQALAAFLERELDPSSIVDLEVAAFPEMSLVVTVVPEIAEPAVPETVDQGLKDLKLVAVPEIAAFAAAVHQDALVVDPEIAVALHQDALVADLGIDFASVAWVNVPVSESFAVAVVVIAN